MELSPFVLEKFKELFEIEILKAEKTVLDNGLIKLKMELSGASAEIFKDMIKMFVAYPSTDVQVKIAGLPINKN